MNKEGSDLPGDSGMASRVCWASNYPDDVASADGQR